MKFSSNGYFKKFIQLMIVAAVITVVSPYALGKLNFYGNSYASTKPSPVMASNVVSYADAVELAAPAVVSIRTTKEIPIENPLLQEPLLRYFFGAPQGNHLNQPGQNIEPPTEIMKGQGSGVIVDKKGYILTNNHVVKDVDQVIVTLADGRTVDGKVIGGDPSTDLAVLKIELKDLPIINMGSSEKLRVGDVVLAIGNPFGFDRTVTQGIVSATERSGSSIGVLSNLIQTDAAISPGNSGGALIDAYGNLVGINTAIFTNTATMTNFGIGFAIPIDPATEIMQKLIEGKPIIRGYLGVVMAPALSKEIRTLIKYEKGDGVYVQAVVRGGPAQMAGLLPGDVIIKINEVSVNDQRTVLQTVADLTPGQTYPIEIFRNGDIMNFIVTPSERKNSPG